VDDVASPWFVCRVTCCARILIGHSLAGLLTLHALVDSPETFNAYLAIENFEKSLKLNPANESAAKQLQELRGQGEHK
jgi:enterochelin esterase-like enzyme